MKDNIIEERNVILSLETSTKDCSIALSKDSQVIFFQLLSMDYSHDRVLHQMIENALNYCELNSAQLDAIAVSSGPGSYTGLRIGLSAAKGLCFALDIPLIAVNTLEVLAWQMAQYYTEEALFCPMIDARRMEVYRMIMNTKGDTILKPEAHILNENSFDEYISQKKPLFLFGNGAEKSMKLFDKQIFKGGFIKNINCRASEVAHYAYLYFMEKKFVDKVYFEPNYLKPFFTPPPKKSLSLPIIK